ncbi:MAG: hypothetical protein PUP93_00955 [Rhizonema sp. NSF051]|nr:hypothetical protein [Rhizonema sp. NSF051]
MIGERSQSKVANLNLFVIVKQNIPQNQQAGEDQRKLAADASGARTD